MGMQVLAHDSILARSFLRCMQVFDVHAVLVQVRNDDSPGFRVINSRVNSMLSATAVSVPVAIWLWLLRVSVRY